MGVKYYPTSEAWRFMSNDFQSRRVKPTGLDVRSVLPLQMKKWQRTEVPKTEYQDCHECFSLENDKQSNKATAPLCRCRTITRSNEIRGLQPSQPSRKPQGDVFHRILYGIITRPITSGQSEQCSVNRQWRQPNKRPRIQPKVGAEV